MSRFVIGLLFLSQFVFADVPTSKIDSAVLAIAQAVIDATQMPPPAPPPFPSAIGCCHFGIPQRGNAFLLMPPTNCSAMNGTLEDSLESCATAK